MKVKYETLDEYLHALDAIKERASEETRGMTAAEVKVHFARAAGNLERLTGKKVRVRRGSPQSAPAKR